MSGESADINVVGGTRVPTEEQIMILEEQAWIDAGEEPAPAPSISRFGNIKPSGHFYVQYEDSMVVPLKGVKIRCHKGVKHASAYTDENGHYVMPKKFSADKVRYTMVFKNQCGFKIWGDQSGFLWAARKKYKKHTKDFGKTVKPGDGEWDMCVANNAAYDHYKYCEENNIATPPDNLRIWVCSNKTTWRCAIMMRHLDNHFALDVTLLSGLMSVWGITGFMLGGAYIPADLWLPYVLPDIFISSKDETGRDLYRQVTHELMHASHFSQVGQDYWKRYVQYIINCASLDNIYGYKGRADSGVCISETWAYAMEYKRQEDVFNIDRSEYPNVDSKSYWFKPSIIYDLIKQGVLTPTQIFSCMTPDVDDHKKLLRALIQKGIFYSQKNAIWQRFNEAGFSYPDLKPIGRDYTFQDPNKFPPIDSTTVYIKPIHPIKP